MTQHNLRKGLKFKTIYGNGEGWMDSKQGHHAGKDERKRKSLRKILLKLGTRVNPGIPVAGMAETRYEQRK